MFFNFGHQTYVRPTGLMTRARRDTTGLSDHSLTTSGDTTNEATTAERTEQTTTSGDTSDEITTDRRTGLFNDGANSFDQIR